MAFRLAQFDWIYYHDKDLGNLVAFSSGGNRSNSPNFASNVRISTGVVFNF